MRRRGSSSAPFGFQSPAAGPTLLLGSLGQADDRHLALARQPALEERACAGDLGPERVAHAAVRRLDRDWRRGRDEEGKLEAIDAALELDEAAAGQLGQRELAPEGFRLVVAACREGDALQRCQRDADVLDEAMRGRDDVDEALDRALQPMWTRRRSSV